MMKRFLMILVLSLLWCTPSFALLNPPIRSYFDKMEKDQWIKYRVYNRCAAVFLYRLKTTDFSDEGGKHAQAIMKAMSDAYHGLATNLHTKILNLEESNYSRAEERLNYWLVYYKTQAKGKGKYIIGKDLDACFELRDSDELKKFFDDFLKTFAGKERKD